MTPSQKNNNMLKQMALLALLNDRVDEKKNGRLIANRDFKVKLVSGEKIRISEGDVIVLGTYKLGYGDMPFESDEDTSILGTLLNGLGNAVAGDMEWIDWDDIKSIK